MFQPIIAKFRVKIKSKAILMVRLHFALLSLAYLLIVPYRDLFIAIISTK